MNPTGAFIPASQDNNADQEDMAEHQRLIHGGGVRLGGDESPDRGRLDWGGASPVAKIIVAFLALAIVTGKS